MSSTICGGPRRGAGILNNETYRGRLVWNRVRWVRSASDSHKRRAVPNPPSEWIVHDELRLRIVPETLWERVKARQQDNQRVRGARIRAGMKAYKPGSGPKFLLSGLLKCGDCGASFVIADRTHYACSSRLHGRACSNTVRFKRAVVEAGILAGTKRGLLRPEVIAEARRRIVRALKRPKGASVDPRRLRQLQAEVANLTDAIAAGALRASPAIATRLQTAEAELERLLTAMPAPKVSALPAGIEATWRKAVANLETVLTSHDPSRGRAALMDLIGEIRVVTTPEEIRFETKKGAVEGAFVRAAGSQQIRVVAGARIGYFRLRAILR